MERSNLGLCKITKSRNRNIERGKRILKNVKELSEHGNAIENNFRHGYTWCQKQDKEGAKR